jgi:hypothetical protein
MSQRVLRVECKGLRDRNRPGRFHPVESRNVVYATCGIPKRNRMNGQWATLILQEFAERLVVALGNKDLCGVAARIDDPSRTVLLGVEYLLLVWS